MNLSYDDVREEVIYINAMQHLFNFVSWSRLVCYCMIYFIYDDDHDDDDSRGGGGSGGRSNRLFVVEQQRHRGILIIRSDGERETNCFRLRERKNKL
jgi:hypothetical protein